MPMLPFTDQASRAASARVMIRRTMAFFQEDCRRRRRSSLRPPYRRSYVVDWQSGFPRHASSRLATALDALSRRSEMGAGRA